MKWTNFHTHCNFDDGDADAEQYVIEALRCDVKTLGFSSHSPLPFHTDWTMKPEDLQNYCDTIRSLQKKYASQLEIFLGMEIEYIPGVIGPRSSQFRSARLDYVIGSVHFFTGEVAGKRLTFDNDEEEFLEGLNGIFKGDVRKAVTAYYSSICEMVEKECPDIIGHLDLIKKNNKQDKFFSETEGWYKEAVLQTLKTIANSKAIVEVNTGGLTRKRCDALCPSLWILEYILKLDIPITLNSDAHNPAEITGYFKETADVLKNIGFKHLYILTAEGWRPLTFSAAGLE